MSDDWTLSSSHHSRASSSASKSVIGMTVKALSPSGKACSVTTPTAKSAYGPTVANTTAPDMPSHSDSLRPAAGSDRGVAVTENSNVSLIRLAPGAMLPRTWAESRNGESSNPRGRSLKRGNPSAQQPSTVSGESRSIDAKPTGLGPENAGSVICNIALVYSFLRANDSDSQ